MTDAVSQQRPETGQGEYNVQMFLIQQALLKVQTVSPVQVVACTNNGDLSPVGFVDVRVLVNQLTAGGQPVPHEVIYNVPYSRLQGGTNAVILDPEPGDIGMCGFCSRDISAVKTLKAQANPGSFRTHDYSDAVYVGGFLNGTPTQFIQFHSAGVRVTTPGVFEVNAPNIVLNGNTLINGALAQGTGTAGGGAILQGPVAVATDVVLPSGVTLGTHEHPGGSPTGGPVPG